MSLSPRSILPATRKTAPIGVAIAIAAISTACAHDIPNERVDRSIQISLSPGSIAVDYEVSLTELTLTQDLRRLVGKMPGADREQWLDRYGQVTGPLNAKGVLVSANGEAVQLTMRAFDLVVEDHPRYTFHLVGKIPGSGSLRVRDLNYVSSEGTSRLAIRGVHGVIVTGDSLPSDVSQIENRSRIFLSDEEERRTKQVQVDYRSPETTSVNADDSAAGQASDQAGPAPLTSRLASPNEPARFGGRRLSELLDWAAGASWLLIAALAAGLGAAHAIQPGHGKTLVTAVALGPDARVLEPLLLGLATSLAHMSSVLLIALVLWCTGATHVAGMHVALVKSMGFAIGSAGLWRLGRQLGGYVDHLPHATGSTQIRSRGVIALGLSGGAVPCWDAVALLLLAAALGRLATGIVMVLAFSAGMAAVLVALGLCVWKLRAAVVGADDGRRWQRPLATASSVMLAGIGCWLFFA